MEKENKIILASLFVIFLVFSFIVFDKDGFIVAMIFSIMTAATFFIIDIFNLEFLERFVFALFISIPLFSTLNYYLGFLMSFKIASLLAAVLLFIAGIIFKKYVKRFK